MGKIVVIGAGMGGLVTAYELGKAGFEVEIYEKCKEGELSYEWHDDVAPEIFRKLDIPLPHKKFYYDKGDWTFVPPNSKKYLSIRPAGEKDLSIYRRELSNLIAKRTAQKAKIFYEQEVKELIIEDDIVNGIKVGAKKIMADLVIDSSGALSKFRTSLPDSFSIQQRPDKGEVFYAFRGFFERNKDVEVKEFGHKAYLKHLGEAGLSWCRYDGDEEVDILVGRVDKLKKATLDNALEELRKDNPSMGVKLLHGGQVCAIPVRYALTKMVGDGYVAIGDCAYMTIPLMGSGVASSMLAGSILAQTIIDGGLTKENLWNYQVKYFLADGAKNMGVDLLKRWLLNTPSEDIKFLFEKEIISKKEMEISGSGGLVKLSFKDLMKKIMAGYTRLGLLLKLKSVIRKMQKAVEIGKGIPQEYDEQAINAWQKQVKELYN